LHDIKVTLTAPIAPATEQDDNHQQYKHAAADYSTKKHCCNNGFESRDPLSSKEELTSRKEAF
jgi:hypothetical protein